MRRLALACSFLGSVIAAGCAPAGDPVDGPAAEARSAIAYGMTDSAHTAVVALLANAGGGSFTECSGSIVQQKNGQAYVLTAAHCCTGGAPTLVVQTNNYQNYEGYIGSSNPPAPAYHVTPNSAYYDSKFDQNNLQGGHDFCMLKFAVSAAMPTLALPSQATCSSNGDITANTKIEHVGFGMTDQNANNTQRRTGSNFPNAGINSVLIQYNQGNGTPGPCEGDSGGPALTPAGAAQNQQTIVATTSFGNSSSCAGSTVGASARVCSEIGAGKFITEFLNDNPTAGGTPAGTSSSSSCDTCQQSALSQGGACASSYSTCASTPACSNLLNCLANCQDQTCADNCWTAAGTTGQNAYNNVINCICGNACASDCATECGGSTSSSSSSSSSGSISACGFQGDPTCINCISGSCCNQATACSNDTTCVGCLSAQTAACNTNSAFVSFATCLQNSCNAQCLGGSSSSSSSTSSSGNTSTSSSTSSTSGIFPSGSTSSSTSGSLTTSSGGAAGNGGAGGDGGSGNNNQDSGCSVGSAGSDTGSAASLAGMLLGLAIAAGRRRRAS